MTTIYMVQADGLLFGRKWAYVMQAANSNFGAAKHVCPVCGRGVGMRRWLPPYRIELSSADPTKWPDLLWGTVSPFMVSERFHQAWLESGLRGIEAFLGPAEVVKLGKRRRDFTVTPPVYYGVELHWNGANLDDDTSVVVRRNNECAYDRGSCIKIGSVRLEEGSWDGSDLFRARGLPGRVFGSEAFARFLTQHGFLGSELWEPELTSYEELRSPSWLRQTDTMRGESQQHR